MYQLPDDRLAASYALEEIVQAGEATVVYRGSSRASGDPVVAKVLRLRGSGVGEVHRLRFLKAASALVKGAPSGAAPLKDAAWGPEAAVLVFVPVPGTRLTQLSGLTPPQAAHLLARAAVSLHSLHQAGVAHLNLAPDNLLVAAAERVFLTGLGWGLVRLPTSGAAYAAPELRKAVDLAEPQRCDVFSLALLGTTLFDAEVSFDEEEARVVLPSGLREELQDVETLETILAQCLNHDPFERPASALALARALDAAVPVATREEEGTVCLTEAEEGAAAAAPLGEEAAGITLAGPSAAPAEPPAAGEESASPPPAAGSAPVVEPAATAEPLPSTPPAPPLVPAPVVASPVATGRRRWWLFVTIPGLVALAAAGVWIALLPAKKAPLPPPTPPPPTPSPVATSTPLPRLSEAARVLVQARAAVEQGDWETARQVLRELPLDSLSAAEREAFQELDGQVRQAQQRAGVAALRAALRAGDLAALRRALAALEGVKEEQLSLDNRQVLSQGRAVQQVLRRLAQEEKTQSWEAVLEEVAKLEQLWPGTREASRAQERAAQALEAQARNLAGQGKLEEALATLQTLQRYLPARPGLVSELERLRQARVRQQQLQALLERAGRWGKEGRPELGLAMLAELSAEQQRQAEVQRLREELAHQLAQLDAGAPTVAPPAPSFKWEFGKGQVAKLEVRASDDHGLARVTLYVRKKGEVGFHSVPMSKTSVGTYEADVVPAAHGNEDLQFFVVAEDYSGHQTSLGSEQKPLVAKRKRGLFGL